MKLHIVTDSDSITWLCQNEPHQHTGSWVGGGNCLRIDKVDGCEDRDTVYSFDSNDLGFIVKDAK